ncbi:zinc-ribbon and DUF3426 domain-containing protein [Limnohabitans sp. Bal53]|uniref:zinc-ribbon and DUF3426 domain-containing protein n=1 Tax=Limnohabitans sp. Bal53 TaxID=1977910 RepID=UPI000D36928D|nr:zinc-ribbon and DUF3426 domain-containing protein [Limnohabitans sp. Bal53]PUE40850.1 hypothetical protein B9Z50_10735 [Limnohabitans sp. Bal53]
MNRITRCPSCTTVYQLGDAHLQAAKGWLRCGACGHVFDSTGLVLRWTPAPDVSAVSSAAPAFAPNGYSPLGAVQAHQGADLVADPADRIAIDGLLKKEDPSTSVQALSAQVELAAFEQALSSFKLEPLLTDDSVKPEKSAAAAPSNAWMWLVPYAVMSLVFLLILQLAYVQRHALVATWPASEPVVRHVCQSFGCQIVPLRDAEGVVIDSSSLVQRSEDHVLTWSVRNTTLRVLGTTALELSLMDPQGKLVVRTVVLPEQTGAPPTLSPGQSWSGSLKVLVSPELIFSDYSLLSFYP